MRKALGLLASVLIVLAATSGIARADQAAP